MVVLPGDACAVIGAAVAEGSLVLLSIGFLVMGAGLAVPYASAPRLALSALSPAQTGQGSGIVNACTFLGGSVGVAGGAIAAALGGFGAVLTMIMRSPGLSAPSLAAGFQKQDEQAHYSVPTRGSNEANVRFFAQSGHHSAADPCPLLEVKRTLISPSPMSAFDPRRTSLLRLSGAG
jgi:hypothetical protein